MKLNWNAYENISQNAKLGKDKRKTIPAFATNSTLFFLRVIDIAE